MSPIDRVMEKWRTDGIRLLLPYSRQQIVTTIRGVGHEPSSDVIDLYCNTGGMADGEMDSLCWFLWPLERVAAENENCGWNGIKFADFLVDSHRYFFRYENANRSSVYVDYGDGEEPMKVAGSLHEFFEHYLNDPPKVGLFHL